MVHEERRVVDIIVGSAIFLGTVLPIVYFHVLKIQKLKGSISCMTLTIQFNEQDGSSNMHRAKYFIIIYSIFFARGFSGFSSLV